MTLDSSSELGEYNIPRMPSLPDCEGIEIGVMAD
jgi:hypothetical protein